MGIILLDIGNVLVNVDFMPFCRAVCRDSESGAERLMDRYCQGEFKDRHDTGRLASFDYLDMIAADPLTLDLPLRQLRLAWQDIFTPLPGSEAAVGQLRQRHELWIMSDTDPLHFTFLLDRFPFLRTMDRHLLSYEHGWLKRSPEAFRYALELAGRDASGLLLIDDRQVNIDSCRAAGIDSILFRSWRETLASPPLAALETSSNRNRS
ncbi:MAG TPA: haloacid dehalogenase [Chlorobaculum parvum]|uniref:Haloacid dehalogenase n=1 Tax=Chlorobaculum parvum TaxID=274539 RepID=A0A7C5HCG3_9CHLB|nr:haloacid dehalogenase [Chlorobaculum parvum]